MPDTKIKHTPQGWIDTDKPHTYWRVRRLARQARRDDRQAAPAVKAAIPQRTRGLGSMQGVPGPIAQMKTNVTAVGYQPGPGQQTVVGVMSGLQQRLLDRLTARQNVTSDDAVEVISNNGYNAAASYGHMREAGANHAEAKIVISLGSQDTSVNYGKGRAAGKSHVDALSEALKSGSSD